MVIISGSSLFKQGFFHPWAWEFTYWINPVEKKRKVKNSKLITHSCFMVLEFILLLKNNNFKYIQSWKQTNVLHLCVKQIWWLMTYVCNGRKWNSSGSQHRVTLHCKADPALLWIPPSCKAEAEEERNQTNTAWRISRPREPPAVCNPVANSWWVQRIFFLLCWQSSVGIWALNWAWLPHTYKHSCLQGNLNPLKACQCWSSLMK